MDSDMEPRSRKVMATLLFFLVKVWELLCNTLLKPIRSSWTTSTSDPTTSIAEYCSRRISRIKELMKRSGMSKETEIEASKDHWTEQDPGRSVSSPGEEAKEHESWSSADVEAHKQLFKRLQNERSGRFFMEMDDSTEMGEKPIAEGGQAKIFLENQVSGEPKSYMGRTRHVLKVYKDQRLLKNLLEERVPKGMLEQHVLTEQRLIELVETPEGTMEERVVLTSGRPSTQRRIHRCNVSHVVLLKDGRLAFRIAQYATDLRTFIDALKMQDNEGPPFSDDVATLCMLQIAMAMQDLHNDDIVHSDLKASNVLISNSQFGCEPVTSEYPLYCWVADFECAVGCFGTGFWRAPEILQGIKNFSHGVIKVEAFSKLYSKESDVYGYAMTCYEILTGLEPFELEGHLPDDYDVVIDGNRPKLPKAIKSWIKDLLERCWHKNSCERPTFKEIVNTIEEKEPSAKDRLLRLWSD